MRPLEDIINGLPFETLQGLTRHLLTIVTEFQLATMTRHLEQLPPSETLAHRADYDST